MNTLIDTVINNGFCIGCGICTAVKDSPFHIEFNEFGMYEAKKDNIDDIEPESLLKICPFSSTMNETIISKELFSNIANRKYNDNIGFFTEIKAGHVVDNNYRLNSSSGGLVSWTIEKLFENELIDCVIHVKKSLSSNNQLFQYSISNSITELREGKKSRYYPIELSQVLNIIKGDTKKYAIVALPCFIKGIRLLTLNEVGFTNIKFCIGIICGQLKSKYFANLFSLQYSIKANELTDIDFRTKIENQPAGDYALTMEKKEKNLTRKIITKPANKMFATDWGMGALKYKACDVCDDVYNETADITFGDAWIEPYNKDWKGTNLIIIKNEIFSNLFNEGVIKNEIIVSDLTVEDAISTQESSIRHRIENIGLRLHIFKQNNSWIPIKRKAPSNDFDLKTISIQKKRMKISSISHQAMKIAIKYNSFFLFKIIMIPQIVLYNYMRFGIKSLIPLQIKNYIKSILRRVK